MQTIKKLGGISLLAATLASPAMAVPQLGNWNSAAEDFDVGNWTEQFSGGALGEVGNLFSAQGLEGCCFSLEGAELVAIESTGENAYSVSYEGASLTLPNSPDMPWYSADDGDEPYLVESLALVMQLALELDGETISSLRFDVEGSGELAGFSGVTVSFSAYYEGLPSPLSEEPDTPPEENGLQALLDGAAISITRHQVASFDIKPFSCENKLNVKARGVLPTVIAGSETLDVSTLDVASIRLAGVAPVRSSVEDMRSADPEAPCDAPEPDEIDDLKLKFDIQELMAAIGGHELENGTEVVLPLTGNITDQSTIESEDFIFIINNSRKPKPEGGLGKPEHAGPPTTPGNQGNGKGWGPDNNPSNERGKGKNKD